MSTASRLPPAATRPATTSTMSTLRLSTATLRIPAAFVAVTLSVHSPPSASVACGTVNFAADASPGANTSSGTLVSTNSCTV